MSSNALYDQYKKDIVPQLMTNRGYVNLMQVPKISKIVINSGIGTAYDREVLQEAVATLGQITGQQPVITKARMSISNFKLREGMEKTY